MNDYIIELKKPYKFEGQEHNSIDLSGLETLTAQDLENADKVCDTINGPSSPAAKEITLSFSLALAAQVAKKPIEFMKGLPAPVAIEIKNTITTFLYE